MKIFATICVIASVLLALGLLVIVEKADDFPTTDAVGGCTEYVCSASNETGTFCRISSTGYRAYPSMNTTAGYRDCINRATLVRGTWTVAPEPTVVFDESSCLFLDNITMCFRSANEIEDAQIRSAVFNASQSGPP